MIRAVVIGLGRIGFTLATDPYREKPCTHVGAIINNPATKLVGGLDNSEKKRNSFQKATKVPAFCSWEELLKHTGIPDLVCIATPASMHGLYLRLAIKSHVPVVVMEKPIAESYAEAKKIKNYYLKEKQNSLTRVIINHERRFANDYLHAKEQIRKKTLGKLSSINGSLYTNVPTSIATLLHDGTHLIDIIGYLTKLSSTKKNSLTHFKLLTNNTLQGIKFYAHFNGIPTYLEIGGEKDYFHFELTLTFSKGKIEIGNNIFNEYHAKTSKLYHGFTSLIKSNRHFAITKYFANMIKHAVTLVENPQQPSASSLEDAFLVYQVMNKIIKK